MCIRDRCTWIFLVLSNNLLVGKIPEAFGSFSTLQELNLQNNQLFGEIPVTIYSLRYLVWLDLSNNQFAGEIPEAISSLSYYPKWEISGSTYSTSHPTNSLVRSLPLSRMRDTLLAFSPTPTFAHSPTPLWTWPTVTSPNNSPQVCSYFFSFLVHFSSWPWASTGMFLLGAAEEETQSHLDSNWKQTTFHSVQFSDLNIIEKLIDDNPNWKRRRRGCVWDDFECRIRRNGSG